LLSLRRWTPITRKTARSWFSKTGRTPADNQVRTANHSLNLYFAVVLLINIVAIILTIHLTISVNNMWEAKIRQRKNSTSNVLQVSRADQLDARSTLKVLWKVDAATEVGIDKVAYTSLLIEAKSQANETLAELKNEEMRNEIILALEAYMDAQRAWNLNQETNDYVNTDIPEVQELMRKYSIKPDEADRTRIRREIILRTIWLAARKHLDQASALLTFQRIN
jgi:hypothetical protein